MGAWKRRTSSRRRMPWATLGRGKFPISQESQLGSVVEIPTLGGKPSISYAALGVNV